MSEEFQADCDHCGCSFSSETPTWDDYDQLNKQYDNLMLVLNPCGYHAPWFCSRDCQKEATIQAAVHCVSKYGGNCSKCTAKIGTIRMKPCDVCEKLVCKKCEIDDGKSSRFCSKECQSTVKHCGKCNTLTPKEGPELCEWCTKRESR